MRKWIEVAPNWHYELVEGVGPDAVTRAYLRRGEVTYSAILLDREGRNVISRINGFPDIEDAKRSLDLHIEEMDSK